MCYCYPQYKSDLSIAMALSLKAAFGVEDSQQIAGASGVAPFGDLSGQPLAIPAYRNPLYFSGCSLVASPQIQQHKEEWYSTLCADRSRLPARRQSPKQAQQPRPVSNKDAEKTIAES